MGFSLDVSVRASTATSQAERDADGADRQDEAGFSADHEDAPTSDVAPDAAVHDVSPPLDSPETDSAQDASEGVSSTVHRWIVRHPT
jgi:hypothetical protein